MRGTNYYGSANIVARMKDSAGQEFDIVKTTYTTDVWQRQGRGGCRLYTMYMDMSLAEVIQSLAIDFGLVELVDGEVMEASHE